MSAFATVGWGEVCALGAALVWSISIILFKRSEKISPQGLNLFKNVVAAALLALTMPVLQLSIDWQRPAEDWWRLALSGILGLAVADTLIFMALRRLGAGLLAVVDCVYAPCIVLLSVAFLGESPSWVFLLGGVCVVGGVLLAVSDGLRGPLQRASTGTSESENADTAAEPLAIARRRWAGVVFGMTGICAMGVGVILVKPVLEQGALVEVTLVRLSVGIAAQLLWIVLIPGQRGALGALLPSRTWFTLVPASVLGSYIAMLLWLGGFKWGNASTAAVLNQLSSVFTIVLAWLFLKEVLTRRRIVGAAMAVAGALIVVIMR